MGNKPHVDTHNAYGTETVNDRTTKYRWTRRIGVVVIAAFVAGMLSRDALYSLAVKWFGPPAVAMTEAHADHPATQLAEFDHGLLHKVVSQHVDGAGWIDYAAIVKDTSDLDAYIAELADAPFNDLSRDGKLALLINAYNAFTLRLIADHYNDGELASIRDIPEKERWDHVRWDIAGKEYSLNQIEHELVRPKFKEPRIHFAMVCAAESCPPLRSEAYTEDKLEQQLAAQTEYVHTHPRWYRFDAKRNKLELTALYQWYGGDFEQVSGSVLAYVTEQRDELKGRKPTIGYLHYSWKLNDISNRP